MEHNYKNPVSMKSTTQKLNQCTKTFFFYTKHLQNLHIWNIKVAQISQSSGSMYIAGREITQKVKVLMKKKKITFNR